MVFRYLFFSLDDAYLINARPGSPHPFFSLISPASSSPDVSSNCFRDVFAIPGSCSFALLHHAPHLVRAEAVPVGEVPERGAAVRATSARPPAYQTHRRVPDAGSLFGKVGGMTADLLDTLGSFTFSAGVNRRGNEINMLAFEVANTVVRGANLMESLSEEHIRHLKEVVLPSEAVRCLVSGDSDVLLKIAALDKKEELDVFFREVVQFGNLSRDPEWHNLDRYFQRLLSQPQNIPSKESAETLMQQLMDLTQGTAELYDALYTIGEIEQHYLHSLYQHSLHDYDCSNANHEGCKISLSMLRADLKAQRKYIRNLKKKSLWSRTLAEVIEKLVDIAIFLHFKIQSIFDTADSDLASGYLPKKKTLGTAGLALHYAKIITQINALVARPNFVPPNLRDELYQGLPCHVKATLRRDVRIFCSPEEVNITEIKEVMEEMLQSLVPMAAKTIKVHHSFSWLGEWANFVTNSKRTPADVIRIETLHYVDIETMDRHILELLLWLHLLVGHSRAQNTADGYTTPQEMVQVSPARPDPESENLIIEKLRKQRLGSSRREEFGNGKARMTKRRHRLATSSRDHSKIETSDSFPDERLSSAIVISDMGLTKVLDVIDGVDTM